MSPHYQDLARSSIICQHIIDLHTSPAHQIGALVPQHPQRHSRPSALPRSGSTTHALGQYRASHSLSNIRTTHGR
eukprot:3347143-Rhodomonas_salina.2